MLYWHGSGQYPDHEPDVQSTRPFQRCSSCGSNTKTDFRMRREAEGGEMAFLWLWIWFPAPLRSCCAALSTQTLCEKQWTLPEYTWRSITLTLTLSRSQKTRRSHVLGIIHSWISAASLRLFPAVGRKRMGNGRGSVSSVRTGGEDFCRIIQSKAGLL